MISLGPTSYLVEKPAELPDFRTAKQLFLDIESKNNTEHILDKKYSGFYPYKGDRIAGFAVSADNCKAVYYVPMRHPRKNIPLESAQQWLKDHLTSVQQWVNHNVVFDATFCHFEGAEFTCELVDTLTLSKVHDTDRLGHGLKQLANDWLGIPDWEGKIQTWLREAKTRDYGSLPADLLGTYACMDVIANRLLFEKLLKERPAELKGIWETEIKLAAILYDMEMKGLLIDPEELKQQQYVCITRMIKCAEIIETLADREWTNSSQCIHDILVNQFGLPILMTIKEKEQGREVDTGRPSFDKDALALYSVHPQVAADENLSNLVKAVALYRRESQHKGLFIDNFLALHDNDNRIHPTYNAVVRTGRMSSSRPNAQQQNKRSKALIHPTSEFGIVSCDYSQIEFRLIVHYAQDTDAIAAYNRDPNTDFHEFVATLCGVERPAAKTINFGMAYGAGKRRVTKELAGNPIIIKEVSDIVVRLVKEGKLPEGQVQQAFASSCLKRAETIYHTYHERFPGIKIVSRQAAENCYRRGYVFNAYGRRRHLPPEVRFKAFNSVVQGCAMDIMKERMVALSPRYNKRSKSLDLWLAGNVHDEVFMELPTEHLRDPEIHNFICDTLESPSIQFRVPIKTNLGISERNWAEATGDTVGEGPLIAGAIR